MMTMTIELHEIQPRLLELLPLINAGAEIIVTQAQTPILRLAPLPATQKPRVAGLHAGMGWVNDDFDEPLPDEFWTGGA